MSPAQSSGVIAPERQLLAAFVLACSNFMVVLDLTVANVSVPHIAGNLGISPDQGTWVITSYAVAEAICVPLTGWLSERFGAVRMFLLAMIGFGLFSLLCGLSVSLAMLVICRIGQGLCGAPLMPMSQTLMIRVFPAERRHMAMGIWAMTTLLGPALGPIIGGAISDTVSWHWIFLLNIPVVGVCSILAFSLLRSLETPTHRRPIDKVGLGLLVLWIGALQILLDTGRDRGWFDDPLMLTLGLVALVGFLAFLIWELTEEHPIVNLRVFRHRGFASSMVTLALCFGSYFASIVVIPQWLQSSLGYPALDAGFVTSLTAMGAILTSQIVTRLVGRVDPRYMVSGGAAWLGCMSLVRAHWITGVDFFSLVLPQVMQGLGMSFFMIPLTGLSLYAVEPHEVPAAAGLQNFIRTMAIAISTALVLTVWGDGQRVAHNELAGALHPDQTTATLTAVGMSGEQVRQMVGRMVDGEAVTLSVEHTFITTAIVLFVASAAVWLSPKAKPRGPMPAEGGH